MDSRVKRKGNEESSRGGHSRKGEPRNSLHDAKVFHDSFFLYGDVEVAVPLSSLKTIIPSDPTQIIST